MSALSWLVLAVAMAKPPASMAAGPAGGTLYGSERFRHGGGDVTDAAFSPDGKELWTVAYDAIHRWSVPEGAPLGALPNPCPDGYASAVALASSGDRVAVGCSYDDIRIVDRKGRVQKTLTGSADRLAFSDDGKVLAALRDSEVRFVDIAKDEVLDRLAVDYETEWAQHGNRWAVTRVDSSGGNDTGVAYGSDARELVVLTPGQPAHWRKRMPWAGPVAFSRDGKQVVVVTSERIRALKASDGERVTGRQLDLDDAHTLVATGDGFWLGTDEAIVRLDPKLERRQTLERGAERLVASPDGAWVVDVRDARPNLFASDGTDQVGGDGLGSGATVSALSAKLIAAASWEQAVLVQRADGTSKTFPIDDVASIAIASDERHVAFGGYDRLLLVTADGTPRPIAGLGEVGSIDWLGFSPDGKRLHVLHSYDGLVHVVVDVPEAKVGSTTKLGEGSGEGAALAPDGASLVVPREDGRLLVLPLK